LSLATARNDRQCSSTIDLIAARSMFTFWIIVVLTHLAINIYIEVREAP